MLINLLMQYISILIAVVAVIVARKELKRFIPVGLFASFYANIVCYVANYFEWWEFPVRVLPGIRDISFTTNVIIVPTLAMLVGLFGIHFINGFIKIIYTAAIKLATAVIW